MLIHRSVFFDLDKFLTSDIARHQFVRSHESLDENPIRSAAERSWEDALLPICRRKSCAPVEHPRIHCFRG